jgi:uncharacterized RDD family membrane protein YckC
MGSALLNTLEDQVVAEVAVEGSQIHAAESGRTREISSEALRQEVAARLAAHRRRRSGTHAQPKLDLALETPLPAKTRSAQIAAAVAERYAQTQSYRAYLAAEAERAIQQAHAAAEVAALNAQAVAAAQQQLLDAFDEASLHEAADTNAANGEHALQAESTGREEFREVLQSEFEATAGVERNLWPDLEPELPSHPKHRRAVSREPRSHGKVASDESLIERALSPAHVEPRSSNPGFTVRLYEDAASAAHVVLGAAQRIPDAARANRYEERNEAEAMALDEEIAFRQAPVFEEPAGPPMPLPANLIEFPRQLVASRKARPRYAEGPLRDEAAAAPGDGQLRIFEVDPAQISTQPEAEAASDIAATPQWTSIWLDTPGAARATDTGAQAMGTDADAYSDANSTEPRTHTAPPLYVSTIGRRMTAAAIDGAIVLTGLAASAVAFVEMTLKLSGGAIAWQAGGSHLQAMGQAVGSVAGQMGLAPTPALIAVAVTGAFLLLLYQALFFRFSEATPGMRCARIALCTFDDENPSRRAIRRRAAATLISACPLGLGFLWIALDEDRLAWHDRLTRIYQRSY